MTLTADELFVHKICLSYDIERMGITRHTLFRRTFCEYKTYSGLKALEVILKILGFVCALHERELICLVCGNGGLKNRWFLYLSF